MKKLFLLSVILIVASFTTPCTLAQTSTQSQLGKIEESLYGFQYNSESNAERLSRLEQTVYGQTSNKTEAERLKKLSKDVSADSIGKEITPVEDTFADNSPEYIYEEEPVATSDVSYPAVDEMENQVFKQSFPKQDIKTRVSKLEEKTFNKSYPTDDLSTRVDRLKTAIKPKLPTDNQNGENMFYDDVLSQASDYQLGRYVPPNSFDYDAYNDMMNRRGAMYDNAYDDGYSYTPPAPKKVSLSTVEKKLLRQTYTNDSTENRLSRLENLMFGTQFSSDDIQTRLDRISSAYQAQKSAGKYDSNKFSQNMATAMQIGTLILMVLACIL